MNTSDSAPQPATAHASKAASDVLLSIEKLEIDYHLSDAVVHAVRGATFTIMPQEKVMLIGPSGCGKSTILKAIAGFIEPVSGSMTFEGRNDLHPGPDRAVVFQEFDQLFPWRTVLGNVVYPLRVTGHTKREAEDRAHHFIEMVGLGHAGSRYPHQLSGGMKQRVAIARALALGSSMLLMDEPFGSLDAITRTKLQKDLANLLEQAKVALLFVTHSIDEALLLGDTVVVLNGTPSDVVDVVDVHTLMGIRSPGYQDARRRLERSLGATTEGDASDDNL